ncbi:hypothetical protein [Cryobacterium sp. PH31-O1]|uniref:hypothetical protein n=1 Tax=Cryobacterium sp. PH31-O1 TaxID=3046306 RepID=UPI0024B8FEF6|nr:hypothetical protein [Cryobacterium sp. PH31-O1]MDJ0336665.1 hypothetical protein [Cryobacterium sp. PH31-O1]
MQPSARPPCHAAALIREQYASVAAAATSALPTASRTLQDAADRGIDVTDLLTRTKRRASKNERSRLRA